MSRLELLNEIERVRCSLKKGQEILNRVNPEDSFALVYGLNEEEAYLKQLLADLYWLDK